MLSKILLYLSVCHNGEILKRIEYKLKDFFLYFYLRNKFKSRPKKCALKNIKIDVPKVKYNRHDFYYIFDEKIEYANIKESLAYSEKFWRKENINEYEDIKKIWENNRLQFLLPIAMKYVSTKEKKYKEIIVSTLEYWKNKNEFEYSINWTNNLEVAIRTINIALTTIILNDVVLNQEYSELLYYHGMYLYNEINYSKCCIPNNHLIGEAIALLMLSKILDVKDNKKWEKRAIYILKKFNNIIDEYGITMENSFSYQFFVIKMFILALSFIDDRGLFAKINEKILNSLEFLMMTVIEKECLINYGDNDNSYLFSIYDEYNLGQDITRYYEFFFENKCEGETKILNEIYRSFNKEKNIKHGCTKNKKYFFNNNLFLYKWDDNLVFINAKNISGHSHNDSLGIELVLNGNKILFDSGTYSYNLSKEKRKYYTSRNAHNTILFDKENAIRVGTFRWKNLYNSFIEKVEENRNEIVIVGIIENICKRKIVIDKVEKRIIVEDKSLDLKLDISNNWILKESYIKDNCIYSHGVSILINKKIASIKEVKISNRYFEEQDAMCYQSEYDKDINTIILF